MFKLFLKFSKKGRALLKIYKEGEEAVDSVLYAFRLIRKEVKSKAGTEAIEKSYAEIKDVAIAIKRLRDSK